MSEAFEQELPAIPIKWRGLPADEAASIWEDLEPWVRWLVVRFTISDSVIPSCWHKHTRVVEELSALWTAYELWYDPASAASSPISWLRELDWALGRIREVISAAGCRPREHRDDRVSTWVSSETYFSEFAESKRADLHQREEEQAQLAQQYLALD